MNKIILMGNLTRDPEIIPRVKIHWLLPDLAWQLIGVLQSREIRKLIILTALHLVSRQSLSKSISVKVPVCW